MGFLYNAKVFLVSFLIITLWSADKIFATSDPAMTKEGVRAEGFIYNKKKFEGYYTTVNHGIYRELGGNSWPVVHGIASRGSSPKEGELSSDGFHAGSFSPKDLDEWFRRGLLPSIIFVLTGVVQDEKYAVLVYGGEPRNAARVFYVTFISGKHLGHTFESRNNHVANVFGDEGLKGWIKPGEGSKEFREIFPVFGDPTFSQGFPTKSLDLFPEDGHVLLNPFHYDSSQQKVAENIDKKVRPLFGSLGRDPVLLEIARHFHQYKLKEEGLERERSSRYPTLDEEGKKGFNARFTHVSQITNALQYYVFKYIQENISHALERISSVTCLEDPDFHALMNLVRRENPSAV